MDKDDTHPLLFRNQLPEVPPQSQIHKALSIDSPERWLNEEEISESSDHRESEKFLSPFINIESLDDVLKLNGTAKDQENSRIDDAPIGIPFTDRPLYAPKVSNYAFTHPTHLPKSTIASVLLHLKNKMIGEMRLSLPKMLSLNISRRESIIYYLNNNTGLFASSVASSSFHDLQDSSGNLRQWFDAPLSPIQEAALETYFEDVALVTLGQILLIKGWSDREIKPWKPTDLKDLNWALHMLLKSHVPVDRENWLVARQSIFSWYRLSNELQAEVWGMLSTLNISDLGSDFLITLFKQRNYQNTGTDSLGYDARFFNAIWEVLPHLGFDPHTAPSPIRKTWLAFTPTLRNGILSRSSPPSITWTGVEECILSLLLAELLHLWWGPLPPPLWGCGSGLDLSPRFQLSMEFGNPKPTVISRISDLASCDLSFVLEEKVIRANSRNNVSKKFRDQADRIPAMKKLRGPTTCLGTLQSCVAMEKLRPHGLLWWAREEPITQKEGQAALGFLLERSRLLCEWNFSDLQHSLPAQNQLYPKYVYLFQKEVHLEKRMNHRPMRLAMQGQIRSHVELPWVLQDSLQSLQKKVTERGQWKIHHQMSPLTQRDWSEKWPDIISQESLAVLERLKTSSLPLASVATVRPILSDSKTQLSGGVTAEDKPFLMQPVSPFVLWLRPDYSHQERRLLVEQLEISKGLMKQPQPAPNTGFYICLKEKKWVAPLLHFLNSKVIQMWLDHHCEQRTRKWVLHEQIIKWIPVPKLLLTTLGYSSPALPEVELSTDFQNDPLLGSWEALLQKNPVKVAGYKNALSCLSQETGNPLAPLIRAKAYLRLSEEIERLDHELSVFSTVLHENGQIHWQAILNSLSKSECIPLTLHPRVAISGNLPPHLAIQRVDLLKTTSPGIQLVAEIGLYLKITTDYPLFLTMIMDQLKSLSNPTWAELTQFLKLPRRPELAESTSREILNSYHALQKNKEEILELLGQCEIF